MTQPAARQSTATLLAFVLPCLPLAALGLPLVVYLPEFYANELGLPLATVGTIFMIVRLLDIPVDPLAGALMDRTKSRHGRFRLWMAGGVPLLAISAWALFTAQPGVGEWHLAIWLVLLYIGWSIVTLAQTSWAAVLTPDYDERSRTYAWWQAANILGMLVVLMLPPAVEMAGLGGHADGIRAMGWSIALALPLATALAVWRVGEPPALTAASHATPRDYFGLFKRPSVRVLLGADLLLGLSAGVAGALFLFYFKEARDYSSAESNLLLLAYFLGGFAGAPLWARLAVAFGKHRALAAASLAYGPVSVIVLLLPKLPLVAILPALFVAGLPYAAGLFLLRAMMADVGDEERLTTGAERTGLLYALLNATSKIGYALSVGITYVALDAVGFQATEGATNSAQSLLGLTVLFVALPAALSFGAGLWLLRYPLTAARHAAVREALAAKEVPPPAPGLADASPAAEPRPALS